MPSPVNFTALSARFSSAARRRSASPATIAGRSDASAISVLMPLLPARAVSAAADRLGQAPRRERLVLQGEAGGVGLDGIDDQRGERGEMIGAALDRGRPGALARAEIGGRQQLGQRHDAGQRRADVVHDAGERGFDRAPVRLFRRARSAPCAAVVALLACLRFAISLPRRQSNGTEAALNRARPLADIGGAGAARAQLAQAGG